MKFGIKGQDAASETANSVISPSSPLDVRTQEMRDFVPLINFANYLATLSVTETLLHRIIG